MMRPSQNKRETALKPSGISSTETAARRLRAGSAILCAGALAGIVPLLYVLAGHSLEWKDTAALYAPIRGFIVSALREFRLPLWNPYEALGMPLFAQMMHGVLHPVSLLGALLWPEAPFDALIIINVALAAAGTAVLAQVLGISPRGSFLSGLAFGTSGYVLSMAGNYMYLVSAASAPWAIAGIHAACAYRSKWTLIWATLGTAMLFVAGDPQWAIAAILISVALATAENGIRATGRAFIAIGLGALIGSIQILPTMFFWTETARFAGVLVENRAEWALSLSRLPELVAPGFFSGVPGASLVSPVYMWLGNPGTRFPIPFESSIFVGSVTLVLAVRGSFVSRTSSLLGIGSIAFLWMALGSALGADQILRHVPVWGSFRYTEKLVGPFTLCASLLAGFGSDSMVLGVRRWVGRAILGAAGASGLALAIVWIWDPFSAFESSDVFAREAAPLARQQLALGLVFPVIALTILSAILFLVRRKERLAPYLGLALAVLVMIESAAASRFALHLGVPGVIDKSPLRSVRNGNFDRVIHPVPVERGYGPGSFDETDRLMYVESHMGLPSYNVSSELDTFDGYTGLMPRRFKTLDIALAQTFADSRWVAMRRFGATHAVFPGKIAASYKERVQTALNGAEHVLTQPNSWIDVWTLPHRPRVFFATDTVSVSSEEEALQALMVVMMRGGSEVIVQGSVPPTHATGKILGIERGPAWLRVRAESTEDAVLVVNEAFWPGWQARIDGAKVRVLCADVAVRAVPWPAGQHILEMRYEPKELTYGIVLSIFGVACLVFICMTSKTIGLAQKNNGKR